MEVKIAKRKGLKRTALFLKSWNPDKTFTKPRTARKKRPAGEDPIFRAKGGWEYYPLQLFLYDLDKLQGPEREMMRRQNEEAWLKALAIRGRKQEETYCTGLELPSLKKRKGDFLAYCQELSKNEDQNFKLTIKYLTKFSNGRPIFFTALNADWLIRFQEFLKANLPSINSAWLLEGKIRKAIHRAMAADFITKDFLRGVKKIKYVDPERTFLSLGQIKQLERTEFDPRVKRPFLFSVWSGLRFSDVKNLRWKNIDFKGGFIRFVSQKTKNKTPIPLNPFSRKILTEGAVIPMGDPEKKVFVMLTNNSTNDALKRWGALAGITERLHFHAARHSHAYLLRTLGFNPRDSMKLMQHESEAMLRTYEHQFDGELQDIVEKKFGLLYEKWEAT